VATGIVSLLTDFGLEDAYVGIMKSVILSRCRNCVLIDLSHNVAPQNVRGAAYLLWTAQPYLPSGTVSLVVVDPGVGTKRRPIAVAAPQGYFVGPDNGFLSYVLAEAGAQAHGTNLISLPLEWRAVVLTNEEFWLKPVSNTFHGRDIFAPAAAALAAGVPLERLGSPVNAIVAFPFPRPSHDGDAIHGQVIHVDHFGNLISDIRARDLPPQFTVTVASYTVEGPATSYQSGNTQSLVALVGSAGLLEIAAPNGHAASMLGITIGAPLEVRAR
jgi:S-adenosylmethionine hydrolase